MRKKLKILMVSPEASPLIKVGGVGDVVSSLSAALGRSGCEVRIIIPLSGEVDRRKYALKKVHARLPVEFSNQNFSVDLWETKTAVPEVTVYLVGNEKFFGREKIYGGRMTEKFLFFNLAVLKALPTLDFFPDIIHGHDFPAALIPVLLKTGGFIHLRKIKTLYSIHSLENQGKDFPAILTMGNLSVDSLEALARDAADGDINFMVQGIVNADLVNTVSLNYVREIMTSQYGAGLKRVTKKYRWKISGILNGIDTDFFDPKHDPVLKQKYSLRDLKKKTANKIYLQKKLGLEANEKIALCAQVSRLTDQKGLELISEKMMGLDCQFVFLGEGEQKYKDFLNALQKRYPDKVRSVIRFDPVLANQIYAAADIFMIPSRFEPCGLTQMIAARYGTVIVARATGGLKDTVTSDIGFTFNEFSPQAFFNALKKALVCYYKFPNKWLKLKKNCLKKDFSWHKTAKGYLHLYKKLVG